MYSALIAVIVVGGNELVEVTSRALPLRNRHS